MLNPLKQLHKENYRDPFHVRVRGGGGDGGGGDHLSFSSSCLSVVGQLYWVANGQHGCFSWTFSC